MSYLFSDEWGTYIGLDRMLLPLEGFPGEFEALRLALYVAECSNAVVHVFHVAEDADGKEAIFRELVERASAKASTMNVKLEVEAIRGGDAAKLILEREEPYDLVIIGGKRRLREELFGSVSSSIIKGSKKPVIAVTSPLTRLEDFEKPLRKILVSIRNLDEDRAAMKLAAMLTSSATPKDFTITALHVVTLHPSTPISATDDEAVREEERAFLREVGELSRHIARPISPQVLVGRSIERSIVKFGERYGFDLIILGERDKPGPLRRNIGAKALYVARKAPCAVAIIYRP